MDKPEKVRFAIQVRDGLEFSHKQIYFRADKTFGECMIVLRQHCGTLQSEEALFAHVMLNGHADLIPSSWLCSQVAKQYADQNKVVQLILSKETTFGFLD